MLNIKPGIVIHQLTDLPYGLDLKQMDAAIPRNALLRTEDTRNLAAAAIASGVKRMISQSIAWAYASGPTSYTETDPLDISAAGARSISIGGVAALESCTLSSPPLT